MEARNTLIYRVVANNAMKQYQDVYIAKCIKYIRKTNNRKTKYFVINVTKIISTTITLNNVSPVSNK